MPLLQKHPLKDNDIEIIETHHNRKIDSPSGTAEMLADTIIEAIGENKHKEYNRHDKHEKRSKDEIGMTSIISGGFDGTYKAVRGTLKDIVEKTAKEGIQSPAVIVTGDTVNMNI